jgi:hypothetical protein
VKRGNFFSILALFVLLIIFVIPFALMFRNAGMAVNTGDAGVDILFRIIPFVIPILLFIALGKYLVSK